MCTECECEVLSQGLVCVGRCGRVFHSECVKEVMRDDWTCPTCTLGVARCARCLKYELCEAMKTCTQCSRGLCEECGLDCVGDYDCGGHKCGACGAPSSSDSWRCVRCPVSFCRGCRPAASLLIASTVIKCISHVKETLPLLDGALLKRKTSRNARKRRDDEEFVPTEPPKKDVPKRRREIVDDEKRIPKRASSHSQHAALVDKVRLALRDEKLRPPQIIVPMRPPKPIPPQSSLLEKMRAAIQARRPVEMSPLAIPRLSDEEDPPTQEGLGLPTFGTSHSDDDDDYAEPSASSYDDRLTLSRPSTQGKEQQRTDLPLSLQQQHILARLEKYGF